MTIPCVLTILGISLLALTARAQESANKPAAPAAAKRTDCTRVEPEFPDLVRYDPNFKESTVRVRATVMPSGSVFAVKIVKKSGYPELDASAARAMMKVTCAVDSSQSQPFLAEQAFTFKVD
jgi:TonB family protein